MSLQIRRLDPHPSWNGRLSKWHRILVLRHWSCPSNSWIGRACSLANIFPVSNIHILQALLVVRQVILQSPHGGARDDSHLRAYEILRGPSVESHQVSNIPLGIHFVPARLLRRRLEVDFLAKSAHHVLASVASDHFVARTTVAVNFIFAKHLACKAHQPAHH